MSESGDTPEATKPPQRVSPITFPAAEPVLPKPTEADPQAIRDAFREGNFALSPEFNWLLTAFRLQRRLVEQSYPSKYRSHRYASALLFWSRVYAAGLEMLRQTAWASYSTVPPLLRSGFEWLGAEESVVGDEQVEFTTWLAEGFQPHAETSSTEVGMGQYMAGQTIAGAEEIAGAYRAVSELARPHFGPATLLYAAESNRQKFALHWADQSFHLGWAQLLLGWQMLLQSRQLRFAVGCGLFANEAADRDQFRTLERQAKTLLDARGRCRAEWTRVDGRERLLIDNFRRQPSGAPKRILL